MQHDRTALLLVDPYNDFLSEGGKLWPAVKSVAEQVNTLENLRKVLAFARAARIRIFFVPHRRWETGDYENWRNATPYQASSASLQTFARGSWGGEWHPDFVPQEQDVVVKEHWGGNGFAHTDLDLQLRQHGIS
jgi:nicotinamidase-related amidase